MFLVSHCLFYFIKVLDHEILKEKCKTWSFVRDQGALHTPASTSLAYLRPCKLSL